MSVVVVSPHLDDAVLSVGGTIHALTSRSVDVTVVTVFAGDPQSSLPSSYWDAGRGATQGEAVRERRTEDEAAMKELGATAVSLPWPDSGYAGARDPEQIWSSLGALVESADVTLLPGWPLSHADHRYATLLVLERVRRSQTVVFYAEQPYASEPVTIIKARMLRRTSAPLRHAIAGDVSWRRQRLAKGDLEAYARARARYAGEVANLGFRARWAGLHHRHTGEWLGFVSGTEIPAQFR